MDAARNLSGEKHAPCGCHGNKTFSDGCFANNVRNKFVCLRPHPTTRYVEFRSADSNQYRCMRRRYETKLHQEHANGGGYSWDANPPHRSGIKMTEFA
jgi:hypothetical protein